jgi:hypothetical protein
MCPSPPPLLVDPLSLEVSDDDNMPIYDCEEEGVEEDDGNDDETAAVLGGGSRQKGVGDAKDNKDDCHCNKALPRW